MPHGVGRKCRGSQSQERIPERIVDLIGDVTKHEIWKETVVPFGVL